MVVWNVLSATMTCLPKNALLLAACIAGAWSATTKKSSTTTCVHYVARHTLT